MRFLIATLALCACLQASAGVRYKDADFSLSLDGDWVQLPLAFVQHVAFRSETYGLHVKILGVTGRVRPERTRLVASKLLEESIRREVASAKPGVTVTITHQDLYDVEGGTAVKYDGQDTSGRSFLTVAHIYPDRTILMVFEAPTQNAKNLEPAAREVVRGLFK